MRKILTLPLLLTISILLVTSVSDTQAQYNKKLIQLGWDYPTVSFLKSHLKDMQKQPFDGVVFSLDFKVFHLFDTAKIAERNFQFSDLKRLSWGKYTDNFMYVLVQSPNGPQWFNDKAWANIAYNVENLSKAVALSGATGILLDPEYYLSDTNANPWVYTKFLYPDVSFAEAGNMVRKRGAQFMKAVLSSKNDMKFICLWLLTLVAAQQQEKPLAETNMALYPFFVQGMIQAKGPEAEIIDGNEFGYYYEYPWQFIESGESVRETGAMFIPDSLKQEYIDIGVAQPVYYDGLFFITPQFKTGLKEPEKESWLRQNLYTAYKTTDKYVWFYNEKLDWWKGNGDARVAAILTDVRQKLVAEFDSRSQIANGSSTSGYFLNQASGSKPDFSYWYNRTSKSITITLNHEIESFRLYINSRMVAEYKNPESKFEIGLQAFKNGNIILSAVDVNGRHSRAYVN